MSAPLSQGWSRRCGALATPTFALALLLAAPGAQALSVSAALSAAAERDPAIASARAAYAAESELGEQERAGLRPTISLDGEGFYNKSDSSFAFGEAKDEYPSWTAYLRLRQPVLRFDWSARGDRADVRDALAEEAQAERVRQFVVRVATRYLDTLSAEDAYEQAQGEARSVRESLSDTQKRYDVELVPGTDLREAQARDDLSQAQLVSAQAALEDRRDALAEITGYDRTPLPRLRENLSYPALNPVELADWVRLATEQGTATRSAQLRLNLAEADLASRRAEALPTVDALAEAGRNDSSEYTLGQRQDDARVGLELNVPIYAGGYNRSRVREASARVDEATAELQRIRLESEREIRGQYRAVQTARAEEVAYAQALVSAEVAEKATRAGYDAGTRTITDVLDARSRVVAAQRNRNSARYGLLGRLLQLEATAGTLTAQKAAALDGLFDPR